MEITEEQALRPFPELRDLVTVRKAGWNFRLNGYDQMTAPVNFV